VSDVDEPITRAHREAWARVVAALTRHFGYLHIAEVAAAAGPGAIRSTQYPHEVVSF
jgi:hypothetical protein